MSDLFFSAIFSIMPPINKAGIEQTPKTGKRKKKKNIKNGSSSSNISTSCFREDGDDWDDDWRESQ